MIVFQVEPDIMKSGAVTGILWHLNQGCDNPVAAMQVLAAIPSVSIRMAMAVAGILPILIVYPFIQSNFVKGITLGGVKG